MLLTPRRPEIDHRTIKLIVGVIAITLPFLTWYFSDGGLTSISASYYQDGWSHSIFIGFLFAIGAFLLAYNGRSRPEMLLSKIAAVAGLLVALYPCGCDGHDVRVPYVHYIAAAVMFLVLAGFCYIFFQRARHKGFAEAKSRAVIYAVCGLTILISIGVLAVNGIRHQGREDQFRDLVFAGEAVALVAFGISWLTASHCLPGVTRRDERFSPLSDRYPEADVRVDHVAVG
jgi:peptidoglycan/LPS O-acetylase OafA/YrhL